MIEHLALVYDKIKNFKGTEAGGQNVGFSVAFFLLRKAGRLNSVFVFLRRHNKLYPLDLSF